MTINKSQGSESDRILVLLPDCKDIPLLTRELLYTAVTRAKEQVLVQGTMEVLEKTILQKISRVSGLEARLQNKDHAVWEP
jgi:exodeoxyribonuclease V alpha subunit